MLKAVARRARQLFRRTFPTLALTLRRRAPGQFQDRNYTLPDRYPWLFEFASSQMGIKEGVRILSFGCSRGDEVFTLRRYFPAVAIKGIDINPHNIAVCRELAQRGMSTGITFATAATTEEELAESYDAIFCLGVLCLGDLTALGVQRCDPFLKFRDFERMVTDFARCLKPDGLLLLHSANFRFCDAAVSAVFDVVLEADAAQLGSAVLFDRDNRLMPSAQYRPVAFRKRRAEKGSSTPSG
jgi:SAM-dependent methyltransferase